MNNHLVTTRSVSTRLQRLAVRALALLGWHVKFAPLPGPRGVVIVYPHTSNWDVALGLLAKWAVGIRFHWLAKNSLFRGLAGKTIGVLLRAWGCIPVERDATTGAIARLAQQIKEADHCWLVLAPEGTRQYRPHWRSGFYYLALAAALPLGIASLDYRNKEVRLVRYLRLCGDVKADLAEIRQALQDSHGLKPECASPIDFAVADQRNP